MGNQNDPKPATEQDKLTAEARKLEAETEKLNKEMAGAAFRGIHHFHPFSGTSKLKYCLATPKERTGHGP
jgi:hypothetical protein